MSTVVVTFTDAPPATFVTNSYNFTGSWFIIIQNQNGIQVTTAFPAATVMGIVIESQT